MINVNLKMKKAILFIVFAVYILIVLKLTVFRSTVPYDESQINLTLFIELINVLQNEGTSRFLWLLLGNIGWFVPFGFLLPILLKQESFLKIVILGFLFSLIIESLQYVFRLGVAELDDLILNVLGAAIGYLLYKSMMKTS